MGSKQRSSATRQAFFVPNKNTYKEFCDEFAHSAISSENEDMENRLG